MKQLIVFAVVTILLLGACGGAVAGGTKRGLHPPLDAALMAFKEQGVWYFLCMAPHWPCRIPPHYATYGPPPPYCPPPLCGPFPQSGVAPKVMKVVR